MSHWTVNDIPDLRGRVALVTGANRGLGLETTRALATHGAHVIMAVRDLNQGHRAEADIQQTVPDPSIELASLDKVDRNARKEYDRSAAARLWQVSEALTGVTYDALRQHSETR